MLEPQDERFVRDFLQFSYFVASKSMFFYEFSHEPQNLLPQNRCFVRGFRQFSSHLTKCQACHGICTLSLLHAALTLQFAERRATRHPREMTMVISKVLHLPRNMQLIVWKRRKVYCTCHTKRLSTPCETCWNVTKCHACHAKWGHTTFETSKSDPFCRTRHRHGHTGLTRPPADGCGRLRTQTQRRANTPSTPRHPEWSWNPCYAFGNKEVDYIDYTPWSKTLRVHHWRCKFSHILDHPHIMRYQHSAARILSNCDEEQCLSQRFAEGAVISDRIWRLRWPLGQGSETKFLGFTRAFSGLGNLWPNANNSQPSRFKF